MEENEKQMTETADLRGNRLYENTLTLRELESLTAICDVFVPSVQMAGDAETGGGEVAEFYRTSASIVGTPERVGRMVSQRLKHPKKWLMRVALWLLSTAVGTFLLCGRRSVSPEFPFLGRFSQLSLRRREQILLSWSLSSIIYLRMLFKGLKLLTLLVFFTQVDEKRQNRSWKAIGYSGPDPKFKAQNTKTVHKNSIQGQETQQESNPSPDELYGPLCRVVINLSHQRDVAVQNLRRSGFPVALRPNKAVDARDASSNPSLVIQCDAVVVGSGSGGGVVAGVLAKAGYKVLVLEKGSYYARSNLSLLEGPSIDQMYLSGGMMLTDDMGVVILAGSTVGGGSSINWSASLKTPGHVLDEWSNKNKLQIFDSKLYSGAMDIVCQKMGVQSEMTEESLNNSVLRRGCKELGYPVNSIPRNSSPDHYCGWCCFGCKDGKKKGTSETWLKDLVDSGNGFILPQCEAVEVLHKRKNRKDRSIATGVAFEFEDNGMKDICIVKSEVTVVAGGALCTPTLLRRSGLKNPNIGKNLHLHPVTMAWGYFPEEEKASYEGGIMTAMSTIGTDLKKSGYGAVLQTPSLHPGFFSSLMPWISGEEMKRRMVKFSKTAHIFALARDRGSGTVNAPNSISYDLEKDDEENLKIGLEKILKILAAAGAEEIGTHHFEGKSLIVKEASSDEFERFVKEESSRPMGGLSSSICSAHQMGSCRMGIEPTKSVVNQMGETWEVEGLYIADSSVFPTALGVNPMVTIQAIAYCTAQSVLEVLRRQKSNK